MSTATATHFPVTVNAVWTETDAIPAGCRKPRNIPRDIELTVNVRSIKAAEFPTALQVTEYEATEDLRTFDGAIYKPWLPWSGQRDMHTAGSRAFAAVQSYDRHDLYTRTLDEAHGIISAHYGQFLIVDGEVWRMDNREPFYVVSTNSRLGEAYIHVTTYAPNAGEWARFSALEWDEAVAYAVSTAGSEEGREKTATRMAAMTPPITVCLPEAVKLTFDRVTARGANDIEGFANAAVSDFRKALEEARVAMDPAAVGRGEVTYGDFLAAATRRLLAL